MTVDINDYMFKMIDEFVMNELYEELIHMPLWTAVAFEKDGEFHFNEERSRLLHYLVVNVLEKHPEYERSSKTIYYCSYLQKDFIPLLRQAWVISAKISARAISAPKDESDESYDINTTIVRGR